MADSASPDLKAYVLLGVGIVAFVLSQVASESSSWGHLATVIGYAVLAGVGLAFTFFDLRGGYCINRPNVTREASPVFFWLEVTGALLFGVIALYKTFKQLA